MSIFQKIGHFFVGLFDALHKAYLNLTPEEQTALGHGTGLVDLINSMLKSTPDEIRAAIKEKFPTLDEAALEGGLFQLAGTFGLNVGDNLNDVIAAIQKHLAAQEGTGWVIVSHAAASALSILFAPPSARIPLILSLVEWFYQKFIKKSAEVPASSN